MFVADTIRGAVERLLKTGSGFVIFDDGKENEYVQSLRQRSPVPGRRFSENRQPTTGNARSAVVGNFATAAFEKVYGRSGVSKLNAKVES